MIQLPKADQPVVSKRHELADKVIGHHSRGVITLWELIGELAGVWNENPCSCLQCLDYEYAEI